MPRVQLALNVDDLDAAIDFYSKLFRTEPAKVRDGYASFAIDEPPLKLVLVAGYGKPGTLNHLGVEVETSADVQEAKARLSDDGLDPSAEEGTECCYATQDKVWVSDFGGNCIFMFDPGTERFERYAFPREAINVRQILGRPGEVWLPESGTEHITVIRTA